MYYSNYYNYTQMPLETTDVIKYKFMYILITTIISV